MTSKAPSRTVAEDTVRACLRGFATQAEIDALDVDAPLRSTLELDSIDFLTFVERLSAAGRRIEESDYPRLATIRSCVDFLTEEAPELRDGATET
ncbi:acyl carrier protein [Nocardia arizonensis]|uniref:acyl carrier protein n=1 Tax=Nocardia arizonensis TaxID=1141647 RepID=UPI0006D1C1CD|nr:phosphopantetheine-binding protein [Nocardia arizonensis]